MFKVGDKVRKLNGDVDYVGEIFEMCPDAESCFVKWPDDARGELLSTLVLYEPAATAKLEEPKPRRQVYIDTCHIKPWGVTLGALIDLKTREFLFGVICDKPFSCSCAETIPAAFAMQHGHELVRQIDFGHNKSTNQPVN